MDTKIITDNINDSLPHSFTILPPGLKPRVWYLQASSSEEKDKWLFHIYEIHALVTRITSPASLRGTGSIYDNFVFGDIIGKGKFGTVRLAKHKVFNKNIYRKQINYLL